MKSALKFVNIMNRFIFLYRYIIILFLFLICYYGGQFCHGWLVYIISHNILPPPPPPQPTPPPPPLVQAGPGIGLRVCLLFNRFFPKLPFIFLLACLLVSEWDRFPRENWNLRLGTGSGVESVPFTWKDPSGMYLHSCDLARYFER